MERFEHGGNVYEAPPEGGWMDFSANINPLGLAPAVREAIRSGIEGIVNYPDPAARALTEAISRHYSIPAANILLGNGATEIFYLFFHMVRPRRALIPVPAFNEYERSARSVKAEVKFLLLSAKDGFTPRISGIIDEAREGDAVILGSPNNPTGRILTRKDTEVLAAGLKEKKAWLLIDESFLAFRKDRKQHTAHGLESRYENLLVIESLTKFYAIPGLRLGFASGGESMILHLSEGKDVWNVNLLAQLAGAAALGETDYQEETRNAIDQEAHWLYERLKGIAGIKPMAPSVNFFLLDIRGTGKESGEFVVLLKEKGILIRDCANYPGLAAGGYIRVAVRSRKENECLVQALEACV